MLYVKIQSIYEKATKLNKSENKLLSDLASRGRTTGQAQTNSGEERRVAAVKSLAAKGIVRITDETHGSNRYGRNRDGDYKQVRYVILSFEVI